MVEHPWMRMPALAQMMAFILGAVAIIIASLRIEATYLKTIFIILASIGLLLFIVLFIEFLSLVIRDYKDLYPKMRRNLFGIKWLRY